MPEPKPIVIERTIAGRPLRIETGYIATQAHSVLVTYGETSVLCAVTSSKAREGVDFFPLTVDYRVRMFAAGKIPGGFFKREARPSTAETLTSRAIDRPIRPMFPKEYRDEVNVNIMTVAFDEENDPEPLAMFAASAALCISPCPFYGPVGVARVARVDGELVVNPTHQQLDKADMELNVSCTDDRVVMLEAEGAEISEEQMMEAVRMGHDLCRELNAMQNELREKAGVPKIEVEPFVLDQDVYNKVKDYASKDLETGVQMVEKLERRAYMDELLQRTRDHVITENADDPAALKKHVDEAFGKVRKTIMRGLVLDQGKRTDGRPFDVVRDIWTKTSYLPRVHGSAIFTRGQTQLLSVVTLGSSADRQRIEGLRDTYQERFLLHYNFPHFSVGETGFNRGAGRREIGHGELAERSIRYLLPSEEEFPYTIRIVADCMESAGSTSMATVCSSSLALFDAGVPLKRPVAGISVGLIAREGDVNDYRLLTDIYDEEDFTGDMDFKVAGTTEGITGIQCDMKVLGISHEIIEGALEAAKKARLDILEIMAKDLSEPRKELSDYAPQMSNININPAKIGAVIGPGGSIIRELEADTRCKLDINDDGVITVSGPNGECLKKAIARIREITAEIEDGGEYDAKVVSVKDFGIFVECLPGQEGLVHVEELDWDFEGETEDRYKRGDKVRVKCIGIDAQKRARLSIRALQPKPEGWEPKERKPRGRRPRRDNDRGNRGSGPRRERSEGGES